MRVRPRSAATPLFSVAAVARSLGVGAVGLLAVVIGQWVGRAAALPDDALRLAGLATIVVGNLVMLQWFRGGFGRNARPNRAFEGLVLVACVLGGAVLLFAPLRSAFGFPLAVDRAPVLVLLSAPIAWAAWRLLYGVAWPAVSRRGPERSQR